MKVRTAYRYWTEEKRWLDTCSQSYSWEAYCNNHNKNHHQKTEISLRSKVVWWNEAENSVLGSRFWPRNYAFPLKHLVASQLHRGASGLFQPASCDGSREKVWEPQNPRQLWRTIFRSNVYTHTHTFPISEIENSDIQCLHIFQFLSHLLFWRHNSAKLIRSELFFDCYKLPLTLEE